MNDEQLEAMLGGYRPRGPDAALRMKVVAAARTRSRWAYAEAMVALVLIGMNLAVMSATGWRMSSGREEVVAEARVVEAERAIAELELPLNAQERRLWAKVLAQESSLVPLPVVHGVTGQDGGVR